MTVATQPLEQRKTIVTRNGHPAYVNAPPRLTQSMADLERRLQHNRELRALAAEARQYADPPLGKRETLKWAAIGAAVTGAALLAAML